MSEIHIHTSDRGTYRQCRRRWSWSSYLQRGIGPVQQQPPLWFGTGIHFALEDFHGHNQYPSAADAFQDYVVATNKHYKDRMPFDWQAQEEMGIEMMDYYENIWLPKRHLTPLNTLIIDGVPQVEIAFKIRLPISREQLDAWGYYDVEGVYYCGTIDRMAVDGDGLVWLVEYKSAKRIEEMHFLFDPQITAYCWAAICLFPFPIAGCKYIQYRKAIPQEPLQLKNGTISVNKQQVTSHPLYKRALEKIYGDPILAPKQNIDFLNMLATREDDNKDVFIQRDTIAIRNPHFLEMESEKILLETYEMLDPSTPYYPNPSRMNCGWCPFQSPCVSFDDGSDWEAELLDPTDYGPREEEDRLSWRTHLKHPLQPLQLQPSQDLLQELPLQ